MHDHGHDDHDHNHDHAHGNGHSHDVEVKKVEKTSPTQVKLTIAFSAKTVADHENMTARQYAAKASLPGFRPGKAPMKMVLERFRDEFGRTWSLICSRLVCMRRFTKPN